jgi:hypothetical protein
VGGDVGRCNDVSWAQGLHKYAVPISWDSVPIYEFLQNYTLSYSSENGKNLKLKIEILMLALEGYFNEFVYEETEIFMGYDRIKN